MNRSAIDCSIFVVSFQHRQQVVVSCHLLVYGSREMNIIYITPYYIYAIY
jgi:hypothetical protein